MRPTFEHEWNAGKSGSRKLSVKLESRIQSAEIAESLMMDFCGRAECGERDREEIGLAVRESVANAVLHGNRCDLSKKVSLTAEITDEGLIVCIADEGEGFNPDDHPDLFLLPDNIFSESGRGLFLVKTTMDEVVMRRSEVCGMEIRLLKRLSKSQRRRK